MERLTEANQEWRTKQVETLGSELSLVKIEELKLCEEHEKLFGKKITPTGLYAGLLKKAKDLSGKSSKRTKTPKELDCEKYEYLVFVKHAGISGFETKEEVTEFLTKSGILGNVSLFKKTPVKIDYRVDF